MTKIKELLCVALLAAFIITMTHETAVSDKSASEVFEGVKSAVSVSELSKCDKAKFKKETGFAENEFDGVIYYASDSVMEVREVLIIKLADQSQAQPLVEKLKSRAEQKGELFRGYAAKQSALLDSYVLENKAGFVFFAVCDKPEIAADAFRKSL
ncbi:MAG: DUF4358 domain-containing protein [Acutalibacteraceae bacterium]